MNQSLFQLGAHRIKSNVSHVKLYKSCYIANTLLHIELKDLPTRELVEQLTSIEQDLYEPLSPSDLVLWTVSSPEERAKKAPRLSRFLDRASETTNWVATVIVSEPDLHDRARLIVKLAAIAKVWIFFCCML